MIEAIASTRRVHGILSLDRPHLEKQGVGIQVIPMLSRLAWTIIEEGGRIGSAMEQETKRDLLNGLSCHACCCSYTLEILSVIFLRKR